MVSTGINDKLIEELKIYINRKTKKNYFKHIRQLSDNIQITCPFHKDGQETKPSASIRITENDKSYPGQFHCFTCGETMSLTNMIAKILGDLYNAAEVEDLFGLSTLIGKSMYFEKIEYTPFKIQQQNYIDPFIIKNLKGYHPYLEKRRISKEIANKYDLGYDSFNKQITFPIYNINHKCIGIGRRSIEHKMYKYPLDMQKPIYGIYELPQFIRYLWIRRAVHLIFGR